MPLALPEVASRRLRIASQEKVPAGNQNSSKGVRKLCVPYHVACSTYRYYILLLSRQLHLCSDSPLIRGAKVSRRRSAPTPSSQSLSHPQSRDRGWSHCRADRLWSRPCAVLLCSSLRAPASPARPLTPAAAAEDGSGSHSPHGPGRQRRRRPRPHVKCRARRRFGAEPPWTGLVPYFSCALSPSAWPS